jgi:negative regulator of flagellin synthesis FlgM
MEIDKNPGIQIDAYVNQVHDKQKTGAGSAKPDKAAAGTDTVVISDAAKRLQEARRQLDDIPDIRQEKVAELKRQVESGTYQIRAEETAAKLIKESLINDGLK